MLNFILKLNMWSDHIPVWQILSSNLSLEESKFFLSHISTRPLWISTQDQSRIALFGIDFSSLRKISLRIWTKFGSRSIFWSFSWSSSSLLLLLLFSWLWCNQDLKISKQREAQTPFGCGKVGCPNSLGVGSLREKREGAWGPSKGGMGCWNSVLKSLREGFFK